MYVDHIVTYGKLVMLSNNLALRKGTAHLVLFIIILYFV